MMGDAVAEWCSVFLPHALNARGLGANKAGELDHAQRLFCAASALAPSEPRYILSAASVLAEAGLGGASPEVARVLVEHLGDNTLGGDGCLAARALYVIGMDALPALDTAWTDPDPQRRAWARAIAAHLRGTSWHALEPGLEQHRLSTISRDPLRESFGWCLRRIR